MSRLSIDTHCQMLTEQIRDRNDGIMEGFKFFVKMYSAVVGGVVVLQLQYANKIPKAFALMSDALVGLIFLMAAVMIVEHLRSWFQYRMALSLVAGVNDHKASIVPKPKKTAMRVEAAMLLLMIVATIAFWIFNPLRETMSAANLCDLSI